MGQNLNISKKRETEPVQRKQQPHTGLGEAIAEQGASRPGKIQKSLNSTLTGMWAEDARRVSYQST